MKKSKGTTKQERSKKTIHMDINAEYYDVIINILECHARNSMGFFRTYQELEQLVDIIRAFKNAEYYNDKTKT